MAIKNYLITGDCHRKVLERLAEIPEHYKPEETALIILGDAGINWYLDERDVKLKEEIEKTGYTLLLVQGNHDAPIDFLEDADIIYEDESPYWIEPRFPHIKYLENGARYTFGKFSAYVFGGAYSVDAPFRQQTGQIWFPGEQINVYDRNHILNEVEDTHADFILSHTCPKSFQPVDLFMNWVDQSTVDDSMELWLDYLKTVVHWKYWLFGHYHADRIERDCVEQFYHRIENLNDIAARWEGYKFHGEINADIPWAPKRYQVVEEELEALLDGFLHSWALEAGGVDNWEWYGASIQDFCKNENVETIEELVERDIKCYAVVD